MWTEDLAKCLTINIAVQNTEHCHCVRISILRNSQFSQSNLGSNVSPQKGIITHAGRFSYVIHTFSFSLNYEM